MSANQAIQEASHRDTGERLTTRKVLITGLLCLIIPIVFFITLSALTRANGPQWLPTRFENPYAYLFNSLLLVDHHTPEHIDHPGTTTQIFGAGVLRASSNQPDEQLVRSVLERPEKYLKVLQQTLLIFTALVLWLFPWITTLAVRSYFLGILIQMPALFFRCLPNMGVVFGSDLMVVPFSIAAVCCCSLLTSPSSPARLLDIVFGIGAKTRIGAKATETPYMWTIAIPAVAALTGLVCALGIATKLTFFPLILISLFCCRGLRNLVAFFASFIASLAVILLPIYPKLAKLGTWTVNLGIHNGRYGQGEVGLPNADQLIESSKALFGWDPLVVIIPVVAGIGIAALSFFKPVADGASRRISWRTAVPVLGMQILCFFAIAKHPADHYLIPLCVSTGFNLVLLFYAIGTPNGGVIRKLAGGFTLAVLLFLGLKSFSEVTPDLYRSMHDLKVDRLRLYQHAKELTQNDVRVDYYFSDSPTFPLAFGNDCSGRVFAPLLSSLYPNVLFFNVFNSRFETFADSITPESILRKYDHLYFLGAPQWFPQGVPGFDQKKFQTIDHASNDFYLQKWTRE
jgi:hypothetical protein